MRNLPVPHKAPQRFSELWELFAPQNMTQIGLEGTFSCGQEVFEALHLPSPCSVVWEGRGMSVRRPNSHRSGTAQL